MVGPLVYRFAREAEGARRALEVMTALATRGGHIRKRVVTVKVIASSLTIGFGGAAGREGPMVQIGSAIGVDHRSVDQTDPEQCPQRW